MIDILINNPTLIYIFMILLSCFCLYFFVALYPKPNTFEDVIAAQKKNANDIFFFSNNTSDKGKAKKTKKVVPKTRVKPKPQVKEENGMVKEPLTTGMPTKLPQAESPTDVDSEAPKSKKRKTVVAPSKVSGKPGAQDGEIVHPPAAEVIKKASKAQEKKEPKEMLANDIKSKAEADKPAAKKESEEKIPQKQEKKTAAEQEVIPKEQPIVPKEKKEVTLAPKEKKEAAPKKEPAMKEIISIPKEKREPKVKPEPAAANNKENLIVEPAIPAKEKAVHHSIAPEVAEIKDAKVDSPIKKSKKTKANNTANGVESGGVGASQLVTLISQAMLSEEEVQLLIDQLLNLKGEAATWTKKNDPVATLKRQLAEREAQLEAETQKGTGATQKLRELRQEYNQEKTRWAQLERQSREQVTQLNAQLRSAQNSAQKASEDYTALQTKVQAHNKVVEEHLAAKKNLQEEITQLKKTISDMELEKQDVDQKASQLETASAQAAELSKALAACESQLQHQQKVLEETTAQHEAQLQDKESQVRSLYSQISSLESSLNAASEQDTKKIQELNSQLTGAQQAQSRLAEALKELEAAKKALQQRDQDHQQYLLSLFPNLPAQEDIGEGVRQHCQALHTDCERLEASMATLEGQAEHYKSTLVNAETLLKQLQDTITEEEAKWKQAKELKQQELEQMSQERNRLLQEKQELERELSAEKSRAACEVEERLGGLQKEKEAVTQELGAKLEKEAKLNKELVAQINKLTSLVQQGQDALKYEQDLTQDLRSKMQAKPSPELPTSNGQQPQEGSC